MSTLASLNTAHNLLKALQNAAGHDRATTTGVVYLVADNIKYMARDSKRIYIAIRFAMFFNRPHFFTPVALRRSSVIALTYC